MASPAPAASDAALIAAWQAGDEGAATELVRRHTRALARFLAAAGAAEADLEDVVQDTFVRAFRGLQRFRGQCQFRTWLLTIGGNALKDLGRQAGRRPVVPLEADVAAAGGDPHDETVARESEARLEAERRRQGIPIEDQTWGQIETTAAELGVA